MKPNRIHVLLIFTAGVFFRVINLAVIDLHLPHGLGGLFFEFSQAIIRGHYALPDWIPYYTQGGIPYAYPPLPFYIEAVVFDLLHPNPYVLVNVLPAVLACLSLPAFYWLTAEAFDTHRQRIIALFAYAALPAAINQSLEGAGLAEAVGIIAVILYAAALLRLLKTHRIRDAVLVGLAMGICVLSSPGAAYAAVLLFAVPALTLLFTPPRFRAGLPLLAAAVLVGVVVAAPYLGTVIHHHGLDQFTSPFAAQHSNAVTDSILSFFNFNPANSDFAHQWDGLVLLGLIGAFLTRRFTLASWFIFLFFVPRENSWLVAMPAALLVAVSIDDILWPALRPLWKSVRHRRAYRMAMIMLVCIYVLGGNLLTILNNAKSPNLKMEQRHMAALEWASENLPINAQLFVLAPLNVIEWTPQIVRRETLNVRFGAEWEPDEYNAIETFNQDVENCETILCLREQIEAFNPRLDAAFMIIDTDLYPDLGADLEKSEYSTNYSANEMVIIQFVFDTK